MISTLPTAAIRATTVHVTLGAVLRDIFCGPVKSTLPRICAEPTGVEYIVWYFPYNSACNG